MFDGNERNDAPEHSITNEKLNDNFTFIATGNSRDQISQGLIWLNERAWPLAGFVVFVPVLYLFNFIQEEKIPLSITSSSVITALPVLFALILLCIALLVGLLLTPTIMLFTPLEKKNKDRLIDLLVNAKKSRWKRSPFPWMIIGAWLFVPITLVFIVAFISILFEATDDSPHWLMQLLLLASIPVSALIFVTWVLKGTGRNIRFRNISSDFFISVLIGIVPQFLITTYVISISIRIAQSSDYQLAVIAAGVLIGILVMCPIQLFGATVVASVNKPDRSFGSALSIGCIFVVLLGLYPPSASLLTGAVFQLTSSGGRPCAVLSLHSTDSIEKNIIDHQYPMQSKPLHILIEVDGYFWVRPKISLNKDVYFISHENVSRISECPLENGL